MKANFHLLFTVFTFFIFSFYSSNAQTDPNQPNILLIIADDMGTDVTPGFLGGPLMPTTPFLDELRETGVSFTNCWASPQCTPTRAAIISGKYGNNTGVKQPPGNLDLNHISVFNELSTQTSNAYDQAVIGKWHISSPHDYNHPAQHGLDFYTGVFDSQVDDYYEWDKVVNGVLVEDVTTYATTDFTNEAIDWINDRNAPWLLGLTHVAPHGPFHVPPAHLYSIFPVGTNLRKYLASIEAMDTELQRLKESIPEAVYNNTIVIFIGDNGTPSNIIQTYPAGRGKGTIYQGGLNVPLIVSGPGVTRIDEMENTMVNATDIFATILEMTGASLPGGKHNSYSFYDFLSNPAAVGRPYNYMDYESNGTGGDDFTIRNSQYKLLQFSDGRQEFYDLLNDEFEATDLLLGTLTTQQQAAFDDLELEAVYIRIDWSCRDLIQNGAETSVDVDGMYCDIVPTCAFDNATNTTNIGCCDSPNGESEHYEIEFEDIRTLSTNNFPDHSYCYNSPAQMPTPTNHVFFMDATPVQEPESSSILNPNNGRPNYLFGIGMNGVIIAPAPASPFIFENPNTGEFNWSWVYEAINNQGSGPTLVGLDCASAHTNTNGHGYHYHGNMYEYAEQIEPGISTTSTPPSGPIQIGWAADGYPILYRFGPDGIGGLSLLQPSFELKSGDRPGDGINAPCGPYNGKYTNDYKYTAGLGDLDECNGITRNLTLNTICGPRTFDYFYVITDDFPQVGRCHVGQRDDTFDSGAETPCLIRMETQELVLNNGESVTVGTNTYDQVGIYCDTITGTNSCDSVVVTKIIAAIPLSLISFEALNRQDKWVNLLWETANEINVSHFEIERSFNTSQWEKIGTVHAKRNSSDKQYYQYQDDWSDIMNQPYSTLYYRLKIMDSDAHYEYSNVKIVEKTKTQAINIFHDRKGQSILLESNKDWNEIFTISIVDPLGREIQSKIIEIKQGKHIALELKSLPANLYFVLVQNKYGNVASKKVVIAN